MERRKCICYNKSRDMVEWDGPIEVFKRPENFWADRKFWAPECYNYKNKFYFVTTFGAKKQEIRHTNYDGRQPRRTVYSLD